jgi:drug/metabolite transporter (DMT)-like permease
MLVAMTAAAFALALGSAFLHALWNVLLARERDPVAATGVAMAASVVVFAPVTALVWDVDAAVWPYLGVTSLLQLTYFALLSTAYGRAELSVVYPVARGVAPVLVLLTGVVALGIGATAGQAAGVVLVGVGVLLVRGLGHPDAHGVALGLLIASVIAAYTLVDKEGVQHASPIVYLELGMAPAAAGYLGVLALRRGGPARIRAAGRAAPVAAGLLSFAAYALVLAALARAPAASVAAVRETSVVIVALLAATLLHERVGPLRAAGAVVVVVGVALLTLG